MTYTKTNWVNGTTTANAAHLNKIEDAVEDLDARSLAVESSDVFVAANGATDGTNLTARLALAASLDQGRVRTVPGQTYVLDRSVVIPSVLDISGSRMVRKASYTAAPGFLFENPATSALRSVSDAALIGTALTTAVTNGGTITSLAVNALSAGLPSGALVTVSTAAGLHQTFVLSAPASAAATTLSVVSQVATSTFPIASAVGSNIVTSATAAFTGGDVGRTVKVVGAGRWTTTFPTATDVYTTVASVISGTSVTLTEAGFKAVSAAALKIYTRDAQIGLVADAGSSIDNGSVTNHVVMGFRRVDTLTLLGNGCLCEGGSSGGRAYINPGDITNLTIDGWNFDTLLGAVQPMGPLRDYSITNIKGFAHDDLVAIQGSGWGWDDFDANDTQGPVINGYVGQIFPYQCGAAGVKVFGGEDNGGVDCPIYGLTIEDVRGSVASFGITIQTDRSGTTNIDGLAIRDYRFASTAGSTCVPIQLITAGGKNATIDHGEWDGTSGTVGSRKVMVSLPSGAWSSLTIKDHKLTNDNYVDIVRNGAAQGHMTLSDCGIRSSVASSVMVNSNSVTTLDLDGLFALTSGTGAILSSTGLGSAAIANIRASKVHYDGGGSDAAFALGNAGQVSTTRLCLSQCDFPATVTSVIDTSVPLIVQLDQTRFSNAGKSINVSANVAVRVLSGPTVEWGSSVASIAGLGTWSSVGNLPVDVTRLTPQDGDSAFNTNPLLIQCDTGPATYSTAAGGWANVFRTPTYTSITPSSLASLVRWWKADAITGLVDGDPVASWLDSSSSADPLTAAGTARPTYKTPGQNSLAVVRFDGTTDVMVAGASAVVKHVVVVAKYSAATFAGFNGLVTGSAGVGNNLILGGNGSGTVLIANPNLGGGDAYYKDGVNYAMTAMAGPMNAFAVMSISTTAWANPITLMVGQDRGLSSRFWNGDICEICAFNAVLTKTQLAGVLAYLQAKWATPALPV